VKTKGFACGEKDGIQEGGEEAGGDRGLSWVVRLM